MVIDAIKDLISHANYWHGAYLIICGILSTIIADIKRSLTWITSLWTWIKNLCKWLHSIWPYTIIRELKQEIQRLKGETLTEDEVLILQYLWAHGLNVNSDTETNMSIRRLISLLQCSNQKALYILEQLTSKNMISSYWGDDYDLTPSGRQYIIDNSCDISLSAFKEKLEARSKSNPHS